MEAEEYLYFAFRKMQNFSMMVKEDMTVPKYPLAVGSATVYLNLPEPQAACDDLTVTCSEGQIANTITIVFNITNNSSDFYTTDDLAVYAVATDVSVLPNTSITANGYIAKYNQNLQPITLLLGGNTILGSVLTCPYCCRDTFTISYYVGDKEGNQLSNQGFVAQTPTVCAYELTPLQKFFSTVFGYP